MTITRKFISLHMRKCAYHLDAIFSPVCHNKVSGAVQVSRAMSFRITSKQERVLFILSSSQMRRKILLYFTK